MELQPYPANRQVRTEMTSASVDNSNASAPPSETTLSTQVTNQSANLNALHNLTNESVVLIAYIALANELYPDHPGGPFGIPIQKQRKLVTRAIRNVECLLHPLAQWAFYSELDLLISHLSIAYKTSQQSGFTYPSYTLHRSDSRGICLILNMVTFADAFANRSPSDQPAFRQRVGSCADVDVTNITHIFQNKLHYVMKLEKDLGKMELLDCITYYIQLPEFHANADAFIVFIMSHGGQEAIICADGARVKYSELVNLFSQQQCAELHGKPKLVFIQECQGDNVQSAIAVPAERDGLFSSGCRTDPVSASASSSSFLVPVQIHVSSAATANELAQLPSQASQNQLNSNSSATQETSTETPGFSLPALPEESSNSLRPSPIQNGLQKEGLYLDSPVDPGNASGSGIPTRTELRTVEYQPPASNAANDSSSNTATASSGLSLGPSASPSSVSPAPQSARTPAPPAASAVSEESTGTTAESPFTVLAFSASANAAAAAPSSSLENSQNSRALANFPTGNFADMPFILKKPNNSVRPDLTKLNNALLAPRNTLVPFIHSSSTSDIPLHGCDLLLSISSVSGYSLALDDVHGSW